MRERIRNGCATNENGCWVWQGIVNKQGYARILCTSVGRYEQFGHRVSFILFKGLFPRELSVCHTCDNPPCLNPDHLFVGTNGENNADRDRKGRTARGDGSGARKHPERLVRGKRHHAARLNEDAVRSIRRLAQSGEHPKAIADLYSVSRSCVEHVIGFRAWKHVS